MSKKIQDKIFAEIINSSYFTDLLGVDEETREFIFEIYLPVLDENIGHIQLSLLENAELSENTLGTVIKLLYAFVWQESIVDLGGKNQKLI